MLEEEDEEEDLRLVAEEPAPAPARPLAPPLPAAPPVAGGCHIPPLPVAAPLPLPLPLPPPPIPLLPPPLLLLLLPPFLILPAAGFTLGCCFGCLVVDFFLLLLFEELAAAVAPTTPPLLPELDLEAAAGLDCGGESADGDDDDDPLPAEAPPPPAPRELRRWLLALLLGSVSPAAPAADPLFRLPAAAVAPPTAPDAGEDPRFTAPVAAAAVAGVAAVLFFLDGLQAAPVEDAAASGGDGDDPDTTLCFLRDGLLESSSPRPSAAPLGDGDGEETIAAVR